MTIVSAHRCALVANLMAGLALAALSFSGVPNIAHADVCNDGAVKPGPGPGDWDQCQGGAWQYYPPPTFDPNSGDGYGPNQPFPARIHRFKQPCPQ